MNQVFLDIETKKAFSAVPNRDLTKLGVSFVGIYKRGAVFGQEGFGSFFEKDLANLWPVLEKADQIIGFNIRKFDFPVLNPHYPGDLTKLPMLDLLEVVKDSLGKSVRLDNLAKATLGQGKIATGWDALEFYEKGEWDKLERYCLKDVEVTRDLYDFGQREGFWRHLEPPDEVVQFNLVWPKMEKKEGIDLTLGI